MEDSMKKLIRLFALLLILVSGIASAAEFGYPVAGEPWYYIRVPFADATELSKGLWRVSRVEVNGTRARDFLLFQAGEECLGKDIEGALPFEVKVRHGWTGNQQYEIRIQVENTKTKKSVSLSQRATSPALKGYWDSGWKNYLSLLVAEENGVERINFPIHATIGLLASYLHSPDNIRVVKAEKQGDDVLYTEIPSQVYDVVNWADQKILAIEEKDGKTGERIVRYHPTTSLSLAFLANLKPNEKATYLVFYNNPDAQTPDYPSDLKVSGAGIGKTIENSFYLATLNKKSGVLYELVEKTSRTRLEHKLETNGSIHWNPGIYAPPHAWYHTSDWENPPFSEVSGPIFYSIRIASSFPHYPNVLCSVTYYCYANSPYILVKTTIDISEDLFVKALRNGEVVFNKKVFTMANYKTVDGQVKVIDLSRTRMHPDHVISLRPDIPWVTFYDDKKGIAFANLYLDLAMTNVEGGEASVQQPFVYIQHGPWYYLARGLVYSFGTNNQTRMLPVRRGSVYYERNAFFPFSFSRGQNFSAQVDRLFRMLKTPLNIQESVETYAESPEGWIVPILIEPFEEGVEDAIGGKKKK
jgi:hypothetical protein